MVQGTKEKTGEMGRREKYVFLRFSASWGVPKERGGGYKKTEGGGGRRVGGALPLAQALINTRPPDRK